MGSAYGGLAPASVTAISFASRLERVPLVARLIPPPGPVVRLAPAGAPVGRALMSYVRAPVAWPAGDPRFAGHTNKWESHAIAHALARQGFEVDAVEYNDRTFVPDGRYDVVFANDAELLRLGEAASASRLLLHLTVSHPDFQDAAEAARLADLERRRGVRLAPRRLAADRDGLVAAVDAAHGRSLIGNERTLSTYPAQLRDAITCVPVTASLPSPVKSAQEIAAAPPGFLWFFGGGAVHKGLDRVLEAFAGTPRLQLHVVGNIAAEEDFMAEYHRELHELPNVHWHGYLEPSHRRFARVARQCCAVVAPSCSEGMSPATATMLRVGLYPLLSRETGITLPDGCGRYLSDCSVEEIAEAVAVVAAMDTHDRAEQTLQTQRQALDVHSRPRFRAAYEAYLRDVLGA